jgi:CRP-like cAMP-binding protein
MGATAKSFKPGEFLFREGDRSECLYIIQKGIVSVRMSRGSAFVELGRVRAGEVLGELTFFDRQPRSALAMATTTVEALEFHFKDLDPVYTQIPSYMRSIIASLADRLRKADETIRKLQSTTIRGNDGVDSG